MPLRVLGVPLPICRRGLKKKVDPMLQDLIEDLKRDEGFRSHPYKDTVGILTIGYGRNLEENGISQKEAEMLLKHDIGHSIEEVNHAFPWVQQAPLAVKRALYNMHFNLGLSRLSGFVRMLASLEARAYRDAAAHALDSKWATQVGARAERIAELFRNA